MPVPRIQRRLVTLLVISPVLLGLSACSNNSNDSNSGGTNDDYRVEFVSATQALTEDTGNAVVTLSLSDASDVDVTVSYALTGSASQSDDYTGPTASPIVIPAGETTHNVTIALLDDGLDETDEDIVMTLRQPVNATLGSVTEHRIMINDDDAPPAITFATTGQTVDETDGTVTLTLQLSTASGRDVTVPYSLSGTATPGSDYTAPSTNPIVIPAGTTRYDLAVQLSDDTSIEADETLIAALGTPTNATLGAAAQYTVLITDHHSIPADTYFALAVTENSHNHTGARLLFLDFQDANPVTSVIQNNVVISPRVAAGAITLDGDATEWDEANLSTVNGLVQNNYPLSEFLDAVPTEIKVGSAWDEDYVYLLAQWEDAGHNQSVQYKKWIYGDQGNGETGWNPKVHVGATSGAPNQSAVNVGHTLAGAENEDRVLVMFPMVDSEDNFTAGGLGCAAYCHANLRQDNPLQNYTGSGVVAMHTNVGSDTADIWHWKSSRTAPSGSADDKHLVFASGSANGRVSDTGSGSYNNNALIGANPQSMHTSGLGYTGDVLPVANAASYAGTATTGQQIPATISTSASGSRGDVEARAAYDATNHHWTVEFRRLRDTGNADDRAFIPGTDATPPTTQAVGGGNASLGETLYLSQCQSCHGANGIGTLAGSAWSAPRIQRTSGSLLHQAFQTVPAMGSLAASLDGQDVEDIAAFLQTQSTFDATYALSVNTVGLSGATGAVTSSPLGINCPVTCDYNFLPGANITLTANAVAGYSFTGWSGACSGALASCAVTMSSAQTVTATYAPATVNYTLTVNTGANGSVTSSPAGIACAPGGTCATDFSAGTTVTLSASPQSGYRLAAWGGDCTGTGSCVVTMDTVRSITASYELIPSGGLPCTDTFTTIPDITLQSVVGGLTQPVHVTHAGDGSGRLFVVEQQGTIRVVQSGSLQPGNFLDIRDRVSTAGQEMGLLSVAFHPDFASNGRFYVNYTSENINRCSAGVNRCTIVSEFTVGATAVLEDSERVVLEIEQPNNNHNGGQLMFGPEPNPYLYIGMGDGGGDSRVQAQNLTSLLGSMLRIDVDNRDTGLEYAIPADNPAWSGVTGAHREIWAYGLRNPWRFSFDPVTGELYAGDVGQSLREEIDIINKGLNYGWHIVEGDICYPSTATCDTSAYEPPLIVHQRSTEWGSITGGVVYRGSEVPGLCGTYLYGDYVYGKIRGLRQDGAGGIVAERDFASTSRYNLSSFGYDENFEVYLLHWSDGTLYKVAP